MPVRFFSEDCDFNLKNKLILKKWIVNRIASSQFAVGDINFIFTTDSYVLEINRKFLSHDYFTDIITFNYNSDNLISGDIYISIDTVKNNALQYNTSFETELHRVMIHGILHLLGFNDHTEKEKATMRHEEDNALKLLNIP